MATPMKDTEENMEGDQSPSINKGNHHGNLTFLAQAAAIDHALTPFQAVRTYWRAILWCAFMCIGAFASSFDNHVCGSSLGIPQFRADFGYTSHGKPILPASWQSAFTCADPIGGALGGLGAGWISDKLGRRGAVAVASVISIVGVLIQFFTPVHANGMLFVGWLINGFALSIYLSCAGGYCAEVSPLPLRGVTTAGVNMGNVLGNFISTCVVRGTSTMKSRYAYTIPFAIQWLFPVVLLAGLPFSPESPWWLVRRGRYEDAEKVIIDLGGPTVDAKLQRQQIRETVDLEDAYAATATYTECFRGENLKRTAVAMMVFILHHATGLAFVMSFNTYFFELAGFATKDAFDLGVGQTAIGVVGILLAFYLINRCGRRPVFIWGMVICTTIIFSIGFSWIGNKSQNAKWAVSAFMMIYNFTYEASFGSVAYVIFTEVSSSKLRSKTVGIGVCCSSLLRIISGIVIPYLVNPQEANLGGYVGFIFGGLALPGLVWAYLFIPETKGRTVDELDLLYERRVPARHFATYKLYDGDAESDDKCE